MYHLEAMSGKSVMGYPETERMLEDIRSRNITGLIFSKLARLARNTKELLEFSDIFNKEDADLISLQEAIDTSSPAGRLFYTMIAAMAQWEREEISSRVAASVPIRAKLGKQLGGPASMGYKWVNKELVIDEQYAPVRKLVYELYVKYKRKKTVARILNEQGHRNRSGKKFSDATVMQMLRDPMAKGIRRANYTQRSTTSNKVEFKPESEWVLFPCPALVSEDLWNECNRLLDESLKNNKRPGPRAKHVLSGYVFCDGCDNKMYVHHDKNAAYRCEKCKNHISAKDLEEIYHEQLQTFLLTRESVSAYLEKVDAELQSREKLLNVVLKERDSLSKRMDHFIEMRLNGELSKEVFAEKQKPMEERLRQLNDQLPEIQAEIDFFKMQHHNSDVALNNGKNLYEEWPKMELEDKRAIVETITEKITIGKEDINIKLRHLPSINPSHTADPTQSNNQNNGNNQKNNTSISNQNPGKRQSNHLGF